MNAALADITLNGLFQDNMVLQRGIKVPIWGTAAPGDRVLIAFAGQTASATTDEHGRWRTSLRPLQASATPADLAITDGHVAIAIKNVVVGEVWVCSGQSNMELRVRDAANGTAEAAASDYPAIREFEVGRATDPAPVSVVNGQWQIASPATVGQFSAAAFYCARELWNRLHVPVGIINASWGATWAEPWTPIGSFASAPIYQSRLSQFQQNLKDYAADKATYMAKVALEQKATAQAQTEWFHSQTMADIGQREAWFDPATDAAKWKTVSLPFPDAGSSWNWLGSMWVRKDVVIPGDWVGKSLNLHIGAVDDVDITYLNGREVGRMWQDVPDFWKIPRKYVVPASLVKSTTVTIVVQIINAYGIGGMFGTPADMSLAPDGAPPIPLAGDWKYRRGSQIEVATQPQTLDSGMPGYAGGDPAAIYNGMIAPMQPFAIKGVIWYQGESNATEPDTYAQLFPAMISGWRAGWGEGDFPFYFVQLAQFQARQSSPIELQSWADLRDAQARALTLPDTGEAVISDIGDPATIHPLDKQDVGKRLALIALARDYRQHVDYMGPTFESAAVHGSTIVVKFGHARVLHSKTPVIAGFAVAGADKVFHYATAVIKNDTVIVTSADGSVPAPVAVRYNWAFNPAGELTNDTGLPASQFRTDNWGYDEVGVAD